MRLDGLASFIRLSGLASRYSGLCFYFLYELAGAVRRSAPRWKWRFLGS